MRTSVLCLAVFSAMAVLPAFADVETFTGTVLGQQIAGPNQQFSQTEHGQYWTIASLPDGWTCSAPSCSADGVYAFKGDSGNTSILLNENGSGLLLSPLESLLPGQLYTLTFDWWGDNEPGSPYGFNVNVNGAITSFSATEPNPEPNGTFQTGSITFTAPPGPTSITFTQTTPSGSLASPILDNVGVSVPEPSSLILIVLMGGSLLGLGAVAKRRLV
jgi:hypothetical protein